MESVTVKFTGRGTLRKTLTNLYFDRQTTCAAAEEKSFVDELVYETLMFEENPADEFFAEKRGINNLCIINNAEDVNENFNELYVKLRELKEKEVNRYGKEYIDWDVSFAESRLLAWDWYLTLGVNFERRLINLTGDDLKTVLRDEKTWSDFQTEFDNVVQGFSVPLELDFRLDKAFVERCEEVLGKNDPVTLRHMINLIHDYSLMGDSKTALKMSTALLPKVEKAFGQNSAEVAVVLQLIANDCKTLGNYRKSDETLLKVIDINKALHGEESSPELVANLVALARLRKVSPNADPLLYAALDKAAKNLPEDELYRLGYFRVKFFNNPVHDTKRLVDLNQAGTKENNLIKTYRRDNIITAVDILLEETESAKELGLYESSLTWDLIAMGDCKMHLGNYHHKTLETIGNLSTDYLTLNQNDDALALAKAALDTAQKIYSDEHPATVNAIHRPTDVYRKQNRHAEALALDKNAYAVCKKIFIPNSAAEPFETMRALADIADDFKGLKDYPAEIKHYEDFLHQAVANNAYGLKIVEVRKNLAVLYNFKGNYGKTVKLYDSFQLEDNSYSQDGLPIDGLIAGHSAVLGEALANVGKTAEASLLYSKALKQFEVVRYFNIFALNENKRAWFAQIVPYYKKAAAFFISQGADNDAFQAVELCKGRTLADQYRDLLATYKSGLRDDEIKTLNGYREKISAYKNNFTNELERGTDALKLNLRWAYLDIIGDYEKYSNQLSTKYPEYHETLVSGRLNAGVKSDQFFTPEYMKTLIPPNHCYISFSVIKKDDASATTSNGLLIFVVDDSGKVKSFSTAVDEKFFDDCRAYRELLDPGKFGRNKFLWKFSDGSYEFTKRRLQPKCAYFVDSVEDINAARRQFSARLSETLFAPLSAHIADKKTLIISPDAELNNIPFETLTLDGDLVISSKDICYVPSLAVLHLTKEAGEKNNRLPERKDFFGMGNAVYKVQGNSDLHGISEISRKHGALNDLLGTSKELNAVSQLFSKNSQAVIMRHDASERNLKQLDTSGNLAQYKRLLFATHGVFDSDKPEWSAIVLSQSLNDAEYDGYITVGEWLSYNLNSDLIYLSACESGRGDYQAGEGIIGIPYALTMAGNKDTVMSLWKVNDKATADFTAAVFDKLSRG